MTANPHNLVLEPAAQALTEVTDAPPYLFDLVPDKGRDALGDLQKDQSTMPVDEEWITIDAGPLHWSTSAPKDSSGRDGHGGNCDDQVKEPTCPHK
jgi:hypothetical protein